MFLDLEIYRHLECVKGGYEKYINKFISYKEVNIAIFLVLIILYLFICYMLKKRKEEMKKLCSLSHLT